MIINRYFKFAIIISASVILFGGINFALAQDKDKGGDKKIECPSPPASPPTDMQDNWTEYKCQSNACQSNILSRSASQSAERTCTLKTAGKDENGCDVYLSWECSEWRYSPVVRGQEKVSDKAPAWASCQEGQNWSQSKPSFACSGACLTESKQIPQNPTPEDSAKNIKLPTNLVDKDFTNKVSWENIESWGKEYGPKSYKVTVENSDYSAVSTENEIPLPSCTFQANTTNNWRVQACCSIDGQDCGTPSNWSFQTTLHPELKSPFDPDWEGPAFATPGWNENISYPVNLDWCDVKDAKSYYMKNYRYAPGEEKKKESERKGLPYCLTLFCPTIITDITMRPPLFGLGLFSENYFSIDEFTKETLYDWQIAACLNSDGTKCGKNCSEKQSATECADLSQKWSFFGHFGLGIPQLLFPNNEVVNTRDSLKWERVGGANSFLYIIEGEVEKAFGAVSAETTYILFKDIWPKHLKPDKMYDWWVIPCWNRLGEKENCEEKSKSEIWSFRTTGAPPTNLQVQPLSSEGKVLIPAVFEWDDMPRAASYKYTVSTDRNFKQIVKEGVVSESKTTINYPDIKSNNNYWLGLSTCADEVGEVCGKATVQSFATILLKDPVAPNPANGGNFFPRGALGWDKILGANYYQYRVDYVSKPAEETSGLCQTGQINPKTVSSNSDRTDLFCLGQYQWQVRACIDKDCQDSGSWSPLWSFNLVPSPAAGIGLVPCGRDNDDKNTPWDERESCQIKHLFLLIKSVLDFILWRLAPLMLGILAAAIGAMYYFSFGTMELITRARSVLRSAGIGYAILLFGWFLISWILQIFGIPFQWWIIRF